LKAAAAGGVAIAESGGSWLLFHEVLFFVMRGFFSVLLDGVVN
jgi:hypothetical protein